MSYPANAPVGLGGPNPVIAHDHRPKKMGPNRPIICASAVFSIIATAAIVVSLATPNWMSTTNKALANYSENRGLWRFCSRSDLTSQTCNTYATNECTLAPPAQPTNAQCDQFEVAKAFAIVAAGTAGLSALCLLTMLACDTHDRCGPGCASFSFMLVVLSAASGIITTAIYLTQANSRIQNDNFRYDYSMGLFVAGWGLMAIVAVVSCICGTCCNSASRGESVSY